MDYIKNWLTTVFGGVAGIPQIVEAVSTKPINWQLLITGIATLLLGIFAKDADSM